MTVERINDAPAVDQTLEHSQKLLALVVWKLARDGVRISVADMQRFADEGLVLCTIGQKDAFLLRMVTRDVAEQIAAHDKATNQGRA